MNKIRVINKAIIENHLTMVDAIEAVKHAYILNSSKEITLFDTVFYEFEENKADMDIKSGTIDKAGIFGFKLMSWFGDNESKGLDTLMGNIMLYDRQTGAPIALLDGTSITGMRTGAAGGIGSHYLARHNSQKMLMIGTGNQAPYQIASHLILMDQINEIMVYNPRSYKKAEDFCRNIKSTLYTSFLDQFNHDPQVYHQLVKKYDVTFTPVEKLDESVYSADIIVTATPSKKPLIKKDWLRLGTHLTCIGADMPGKQEIDENIFAISRVFVDDIDKTSKTGEMEMAIQLGTFKKEDIVGEIGEVILGKKLGRTSDEDITIFDATGLAAQDMLSAKLLYDKAEKHNIGVTIEL